MWQSIILGLSHPKCWSSWFLFTWRPLTSQNAQQPCNRRNNMHHCSHGKQPELCNPKPCETSTIVYSHYKMIAVLSSYSILDCQCVWNSVWNSMLWLTHSQLRVRRYPFPSLCVCGCKRLQKYEHLCKPVLYSQTFSFFTLYSNNISWFLRLKWHWQGMTQKQFYSQSICTCTALHRVKI